MENCQVQLSIHLHNLKSAGYEKDSIAMMVGGVLLSQFP